MPLEQIPLFEESQKPGKAVLTETPQEKTVREAAETKAAFARIQEVVKNTPSWQDLRRSGQVEDSDDGRNRHARKLRPASEGDARAGGWLREHEARQDDRAEQYGPAATHIDEPDELAKK